MKDEEKDELGSINILDFNPKTGKIVEIEEDANYNRIPEIETQETEREMTPEMQSMINGTYIEDKQKAEEDYNKKIEKKKESGAKILVILVLIIILIGSFFAMLKSFQGVKNEKEEVKEVEVRTKFLTQNAKDANNIKEYFKVLAKNADNYNKGIILTSSMNAKAKQTGEDIDESIKKLESRQEEFDKYNASGLYSIMYGRLTEAKNLAELQELSDDAVGLAYKTNDFIINENDNSEKYEKILKEFLESEKISYREESGKLIYTTEEAK